MILPSFVLPFRANQRWQYSGIDSLNECLNRQHFNNYPFAVEYVYNSRGFRDQEWPISMEQLKNAVWCIGDSFTVGVGSPVEHTWPWLLQKHTGLRTINVSMDGASNSWICRKTQEVLKNIQPLCVVIHWSYVARRELDLRTVQNAAWNKFYQTVRDPSWPDCDDLSNFDQLPEYIKQEINSVHAGIPVITDEDLRSPYDIRASDEDNINNTINCIDQINTASADFKILHSFIPEFCGDAEKIYAHLKQQKINFIPEFSRLDWARDYHHYDKLTSEMFVNQITSWLNAKQLL